MGITRYEFGRLKQLSDRDHPLEAEEQRDSSYAYELNEDPRSPIYWAVEQVQDWRVQFPVGFQ